MPTINEVQLWAKDYGLPFGVVAASYMGFYMGNIYTPRIEISVDGKLIEKDGHNLLLITSKAKNTGNTRVNMIPNGSWVDVTPCAPYGAMPFIADTQWKDPFTAYVFSPNACLETGEVIEDQVLLRLPDANAPAYKIKVRLKGKTLFSWVPWVGEKVWGGSVTIVPKGVIA